MSNKQHDENQNPLLHSAAERQGVLGTKAADAQLGFFSVACGPDGPDAWAIARQWNDRWQGVKSGQSPAPAMVTAENLSPETAEHLTIYPPRSLGEAFRRYRAISQWTDGKKPRTREDWWRVWKWIKPVFGDCDPRTVTLEDIDAWRVKIEAAVSLREAHRCLKIWRAMWRVAAALGYCEREADPSLGVRNRSAPGRSATWTEGEVVRLYKRARRDGYHGLAAVIAVAWSTQLSPGDVRSLRASQLARNGGGALFFQTRAKTGTPVGGALSDRALAALDAYIGHLGVELHGEAYIFRNRSGAPYSSDTLGDDFRDVRRTLFGERENGRWLTSGDPARSRLSPGTPRPSNWRTRWGTLWRRPTPCLRPTSRQIRHRFAPLWTPGGSAEGAFARTDNGQKVGTRRS